MAVPKSLAQAANVPATGETALGECHKRAKSGSQKTPSVRPGTGRGANTGGQEPGSDKRQEIQGNEEASLKSVALKRALVKRAANQRPTEE